MDSFSLKKLEFDKVKEMLEALCQTPLGVPHVRELEPETDRERITSLQAETSEAVDALRLHPDLRMDGVEDLTPLLRRTAVGGVLNTEELLHCRTTLAAAGRIAQGIAQIKSELPHLRSRSNRIDECRQLQERINYCILPEGGIADRASQRLAGARQAIRQLELNARTQLDEILTKQDWVRYLQEPIYTMRGERYVVPVKQEYRHQFPGIVHDQSASGATVFMEPMPLVNTMNDLMTARATEHQEEERILENLSRLVDAFHDQIVETLRLLGELDFIFAKGYLSQRMRGVEPLLASDQGLVLKRARHPLLKGEVVPLDLVLGKDFDCLVITGPNTGGKTVALKTVGLMVVMAQSGLHLPAAEGTTIPLYKDVFADIGDEQSIEQSLSTFSGHMTNIVRILARAERGCLVILDELGAGTDPEEGAALGMAVLEYLMHRGVITIATTHYSELKVFAHNLPRAENASVEFDRRSLKPTFRLTIGAPGESNAFAIAAGLGLNREVVDRARDLLKPEKRELSDLIQTMKQDQQLASAARAEAERQQAEVEQLRLKLKSGEERLRAREREILAKANDEARELVRTARREAEELIRSLRTQQEQELKMRISQAEETKSKLQQMESRLAVESEKTGYQPQGETLASVVPGERVAIPRYNQDGYVLEKPNDNGDVLVQVGILKLSLPLSELRRSSRKRDEQLPQPRRGDISAGTTVSPEIDLRGQRVEEALLMVDKYLDQAFLAGLKSVSLIHGKGTGALREAVRDYLGKHPHVKSFRYGNFNEGGTGNTVVEFK